MKMDRALWTPCHYKIINSTEWFPGVETMAKKKDDRIAAVLFLFLAGIWTFLTLQIPPATVKGAPGPRFFPWLLICGLVVLSIILFLQSFKPEQEEDIDCEVARKGVDWIGLGTLAMLFVYIKFVDLIGLRWGTLVMMPFFLYISFQMRNIFRIVLISGLLAFGVDLIFRVLLNLPLPMGKLF